MFACLLCCFLDGVNWEIETVWNVCGSQLGTERSVAHGGHRVRFSTQSSSPETSEQLRFDATRRTRCVVWPVQRLPGKGRIVNNLLLCYINAARDPGCFSPPRPTPPLPFPFVIRPSPGQFSSPTIQPRIECGVYLGGTGLERTCSAYNRPTRPTSKLEHLASLTHIHTTYIRQQ